MESVLALTVLTSLLLLAMWGANDKDAEAALKLINETIAQCEESLPRDRHCEVVISAKEVVND